MVLPISVCNASSISCYFASVSRYKNSCGSQPDTETDECDPLSQLLPVLYTCDESSDAHGMEHESGI